MLALPLRPPSLFRHDAARQASALPVAQGSPDDTLRALVAALGDRRPIEPRLVGGFAHASCTPGKAAPTTSSRSPAALLRPSPEPTAFDALSDAGSALLAPNPKAETGPLLHARGIWHLIWLDDEEGVDRAVHDLETAATLAAGDDRRSAAAFSDLAAAYLVRAAVKDQPLDLILALDASGKALERDPGLAEALFNEALATELLHLRNAAVQAWDRYLQVEPGGAWADEARLHLRELSRPSAAEAWEAARPILEAAILQGDHSAVAEEVRLFPNQARIWVEEGLLTQWAERFLVGNLEQAGRTLRLARSVAGELNAQELGSMPADAVAAIDRATDEQRRALAQGHRAFGEALELRSRQDLEQASETFGRAEASLRTGGSPFLAWPIYYQVISLYFEEPDNTISQLESLDESLPAGRYPLLHGRILWMLGLTEYTRGHPAAAIPYYRAGIETFRAIRHPDAGTLTGYLASVQETLGADDEAWKNQIRALALLTTSGKPNRLYNLFFTVIDLLLERGNPQLARHFEPDLLAAARGWNEPGPLAEAYLTRSRIRAGLDQSQEALADIARARPLAEQMPPGGQRNRLLADIERAEGATLARTDPRRAISILSEAARVYQSAGHTVRLFDVLTARAQAHVALGELDAAERDLLRTITGYETRRPALPRAADRANAFERAQPTFDAMVRFELDQRQDPWTALRFADRGRARELVTGDPAPRLPENQAELLASIPARFTLVEYSALPDRLVIWTLRRDSFSTHTVPMTPSDLTAAVHRFRSAIESRLPIAEIQPLGRSLFEALLRPVVDVTARGDSLVLIPDRALHRLPFAALWNARDRQFLIERHPLLFAPSLRHALAPRNARPHSTIGGPALVVGASVFDRNRHPGLSALPGAEDEARLVARLFERPELLLGRAATPDHVLEGMRSARIVHIAAHAVSDPASPERSVLLLAPDDSKASSGELAIDRLVHLRMPETSLVFLSACSLASSLPGSGREGPAGVPRGLLEAGAQTVVANLWKTPDAETGALVRRFYQALSITNRPATALCEAQRWALHSPSSADSHPLAWAGWTPYVTSIAVP